MFVYIIMNYEISMPTIVEPIAGFSSNSQIDFSLNFEGKQLVNKTCRLNGFLCVSTAPSPPAVRTHAITEGDIVFLNSNAGISAVIRQVIVSFNNNMIENIDEYGRYEAAKTEAMQIGIDNCTRMSNVLELKGYQSD